MPLKRRSNYEQIQVVAAKGTRDFYREAAELEGLELREWMRETLHARATRTLAAHGVRREAPPVHPKPPPPLQPR